MIGRSSEYRLQQHSLMAKFQKTEEKYVFRLLQLAEINVVLSMIEPPMPKQLLHDKSKRTTVISA